MFTIYSKPNCPNCTSAKQLLESKGLEFQVLELDMGQDKNPETKYYTIQELKQRVPTAQSVPQIFIEGKLDSREIYIGGFNSLKKYLEA